MNITKNYHIKSKNWILLIAIMGSLLYFQTYNFEYNGDDGIYSTDNSITKKGLDEWPKLFQYGSYNFVGVAPSNTGTYRPLTLLSFAVEKQFFGEFSSTNGHVFNIILYFLNLLFIGWVLLKLCEFKKLPLILPLLMLILFAVHPIHTEVVANVKSRDALLAALFSFIAISLWLQKSDKNISILSSFSIGFLFFLGLLCKEEVITFVAVIGLISYFILNKSISQSFKSALIFLIPAIIYFIIRQIILDSSDASYASIINSILYAANDKQFLATNLFIYLQYLKLLVFPHPLSWDYSFNQIPLKDFTNIWVWVSFFIFLTMVYFIYKGLKKRSFISFLLLFYLATFSVFANLINSLIVGSTLGERFLYLPSLAFSMFLVYIIYITLQKLKIKKIILSLLLVFIPINIILAFKSYNRSKVWQTNLTLYESGIKTSPKSWRTHISYGNSIYNIAKKHSKEKIISKDSLHQLYGLSIKSLVKGLEIVNNKARIPQYELLLANAYLNHGDTLKTNNLVEILSEKYPNNFDVLTTAGFIYNQWGNFEKSLEFNKKSLSAKNVNFFIAYKNLGVNYFKLSKKEEAALAFEKALEYANDEEIRSILAFVYFEKGDLVKANRFDPEKYKVNASAIKFYNSLKKANEANKEKKYQTAVNYFKEAGALLEENGGVEKYPTFYSTYANAALNIKDNITAKKLFLKALEVNPNDSFLLRNLGVIAFNSEKNYVQAESYFKKCLENSTKKSFSDYVNLGSVLLIQKKENEAIEAFENALKYGSNKGVIGNLYLLYKLKNNKEKMEYYLSLLNS